MQWRHRTCTNPRPANGGKECPGFSSRGFSCNAHPCKSEQTRICKLPRKVQKLCSYRKTLIEKLHQIFKTIVLARRRVCLDSEVIFFLPYSTTKSAQRSMLRENRLVFTAPESGSPSKREDKFVDISFRGLKEEGQNDVVDVLKLKLSISHVTGQRGNGSLSSCEHCLKAALLIILSAGPLHFVRCKHPCLHPREINPFL